MLKQGGALLLGLCLSAPGIVCGQEVIYAKMETSESQPAKPAKPAEPQREQKIQFMASGMKFSLVTPIHQGNVTEAEGKFSVQMQFSSVKMVVEPEGNQSRVRMECSDPEVKIGDDVSIRGTQMLMVQEGQRWIMKLQGQPVRIQSRQQQDGQFQLQANEVMLEFRLDSGAMSLETRDDQAPGGKLSPVLQPKPAAPEVTPDRVRYYDRPVPDEVTPAKSLKNPRRD